MHSRLRECTDGQLIIQDIFDHFAKNIEVSNRDDEMFWAVGISNSVVVVGLKRFGKFCSTP